MDYKNIRLALLFSCFCLQPYLRAAKETAVKNYSWGTIEVAPNQCLELVDKGVLFKPCAPIRSSQKWIFNSQGNIRGLDGDSNVTDECIGINLKSTGKVGTPVQFYKCNSTNFSMKWKIEPTEKQGNFHIKSLTFSTMCLARADDGKAVIMPCEKTLDQLFILKPDYAFSRAMLLEAGIKNDSWMEQIYTSRPNTALKDIMIPGTHDSGTYAGFSDISTTQTKSVFDQLKDGIRYLDLRVGSNNNIIHGIEKGPLGSLTKVLEQIKSFADAHPKEVIFVDLHEIPDQAQGIERLKKALDISIAPRLLSSNLGPQQLTFAQVWESPGKNIVLLVKQLDIFNRNTKNSFKEVAFNKSLGAVMNYANSSNDNWAEVWPNSTDFEVIENKNRVGLSKRNMKKWHMSQLLRTPRILDAIASVLKIRGGPSRLVSEKTSDGYFNMALDKWIYDWVNVSGLKVNFVALDFYELSNAVPMIIWLNYQRS